MKVATIQLVVEVPHWDQYELLDVGAGQKLERVGPHTIRRSEPKAWWQPTWSPKRWAQAEASLAQEGQKEWQIQGALPREWVLPWQDLRLQVKLTTMSKHIGIFPEHDSQWRWLQMKLRAANRPVKLLNLFGYTGVASLVAAQAGAQVTHVDASRAAITWARENQTLSNLQAAPIRWILDDALKFVKREIRRGQKYDAIILDPPAFGRGPSGQIWKLERDLPELLNACQQVLSPEPLLVALTTYTADASAFVIHNLVRDLMPTASGLFEAGELVIPATSGPKPLALSIFGRWSV